MDIPVIPHVSKVVLGLRDLSVFYNALHKFSEMDNTEFPDNTRAVDYCNYYAILLVFTLNFLFLFLWRSNFWRESNTSHPYILLVGQPNSGKTYLFSQLLFVENLDTFPSICVNTGIYYGEHGYCNLVDIPGYDGLRAKFLDQYKYLAKGVIFIIDSVTIQNDIEDVADYLYTILTDRALSSTPTLILCNKQDETTAKGSAEIQNLLEYELNRIRTTRSNDLQSIFDIKTSRKEIYLGKRGKYFSFNHLVKKVQFVTCSAKERELESFINWIENL